MKITGKKSFLICLLTGLALALVLLWFGILRFNYPSLKRFPVRGIDVSHHQGIIDWRRVHAGGISFVYIKSTEGGDFKDPLFARNWKEARAAGLQTGAYHFFSLCQPAVKQAQNILDTVPPDSSAVLPLGIDLEFDGNCRERPSKAAFALALSDFDNALSVRFLKKPVFYVTEEFYKAYFKDARVRYPPHRWWIRNVLSEPTPPPDRWTLWQYGNRGHVAGIKTIVDLDLFHGSRAAFADYVRGMDDD